MIGKNFSTKHLQISKANSVIISALSITIFILVFTVVASRSLLSQRTYQNRAISQKETTLKDLYDSRDTAKNLSVSFQAFVNRPNNIISGISNGSGERDGDNAKIILDALPSSYDFPGLISSVEKVLIDNNFLIEEFDGDDEEINRLDESSAVPVEMPFTFTVNNSYASIRGLLLLMEQSIRPIHISNIIFSADEGSVQFTIEAKSYYLPNKSFIVESKELK